MSGTGRHRFTRRGLLCGGLSALAPQGFAAEAVRGVVSGLDTTNALIMEDRQLWRQPQLLIPRAHEPAGPMVRARLRKMYVGRTVEGLPTLGDDRWGRRAVTIMSEGLSASDLLARGLARLRPEQSLPSIDHLFAAEWEARSAERGLWQEPAYAVRTPDPNGLAQDMDSWQIVGGAVVEAKNRGGRTFLNFGSDWRTDFTVVVSDEYGTLMDAKPETLTGATVEVRGWIEMVNGPSIWLDDPRALRIMD